MKIPIEFSRSLGVPGLIDEVGPYKKLALVVPVAHGVLMSLLREDRCWTAYNVRIRL